MSESPSAPSPRSRVRRAAQRAHYDRETIESIARNALVCHIAFADAQGVHCIPSSCWFHDGHLYIHGAPASRMLKALLEGEASVTLTLLDGLVFARSAMHHSMNYRSLVAYGRFEKVENEEDKRASFAAFIETYAPGRWAQVRSPNAKELAATTVLRLPLDEASAKIRSAGPKDDAEDLALPVWAGVVPTRLSTMTPLPEAGCENLAAPAVHLGEDPPYRA